MMLRTPRAAGLSGFSRDDRAVSAMMEDISAFIVVVIGVGIFALTALHALGSYAETSRAATDFGEALGLARRSQNHPAFLTPFSATTGDFDASRVEDLRSLAQRDPSQAANILEMRAHSRIRILDISCRPEPCVSFDLDNGVPDKGGNLLVFHMPVTLRLSASNVHGAIMELIFWYR